MNGEFPKYLMKIGRNRKYLPLGEAAKAYDCGHADVRFGRYVLNEDYSVREMTNEDRDQISKAADNYSASK